MFSHAFHRLAGLGLTVLLCAPLAAQNGPASARTIATFDFENLSAISSWQEEKKKDEAPCVLALDSVAPHAGKFSFKFGSEKDVDATRTAYSRVGVGEPGPGRRIEVEFYARTSEAIKAKASFRVLEFAAGKPSGWAGPQMDMIVLDKGAQWSLYRVEVPLRDGTDAIFLFPTLAKPKAGDALWLDNLTVSLIR